MNLEAASALAVELSHSSSDKDPVDLFSIQFDVNNSDVKPLLKIAMHDLVHTSSSERWTGIQRNYDWPQWYLFQSRDYLFARIPASLTRSQPLDKATQTSYLAMFECMQKLGYPHLCRTWNYFPDITKASRQAHNRYEFFCTGRSRAYQIFEPAHSQYPAATVVGSQDTDLCIYFIASKQPGHAIENSKQVSAYNYPKQYSEDPPLFSRALIHETSAQTILFISGTASIRGHASQHSNDIQQQTAVCLDNIETLIETANHSHGLNAGGLAELTMLKVYIKRPEDYSTVKTLIASSCSPQPPVSYLHGDLCRDDLLVEIEAVLIKKR